MYMNWHLARRKSSGDKIGTKEYNNQFHFDGFGSLASTPELHSRQNAIFDGFAKGQEKIAKKIIIN